MIAVHQCLVESDHTPKPSLEENKTPSIQVVINEDYFQEEKFFYNQKIEKMFADQR